MIIGTIFLLSSGYLGMTYLGSSKGRPNPVEKQEISNDEGGIQDISEDQGDERAGSSEEEKVTYEITKLNKKDGDIFSVPDEVLFTITPAVDKSKITLKSAEGAVLYTGEVAGSVAKFTVYPEKKITEGAKGELLIQGYIGSNVVVYQKVRVIF